MAEVYAHAVEAMQGRTAWARRTATLRWRWTSSRRRGIGTEKLKHLVQRMAERIGRSLERSGLITRDIDNAYLAFDPSEEAPIHGLLGSSITYRIATGPREGQKVFTLQTLPAEPEAPRPQVAESFAADFIEQLFADGITGGCGGNNYCPSDPVTRAQMAVFLLRAKHGAGYTPPPPSGAEFGDVASSHWAVAWIEQLAAEGITNGCGGGIFCPDQYVTRAQLAVFMVRTFGL